MMHRAPDPPCDPQRLPPGILIGNELALYREVLSGVFQALRPEVPVWVVLPGELDAAVACLRPRLVICSAASAVVEELAPAWVVLHPDTGRHSTISVTGARRTILHPTIDELVRLIDEIWGDPPPPTR